MRIDGTRVALSRIILVAGLAGSLGLEIPYSAGYGVVLAGQSSDDALRGKADAMMKNIEDMIAHGGMGDAKAIVHHCAEASRYAETLLAQLPPADPRRSQAAVSLNEVIVQCKKVSDIGPHADPGRLLNPAIKARTAARESVKTLGLNPKS
jgi:hypothetical protein